MIKNYIKNFDFILAGNAILLTIFGLVSIYSSSIGNGDFLNFKKQIAFLVVGIIFMILFSFFDWRTFRSDPYIILIPYIFSIIALFGLLFLAPEIRGTKSWYQFGIFSFGPIEMTKIVIILLLAKYFSQRHVELYNIRHILISGIYVFIPAFLIFLQPDMGSVILFIAIWIGILLISGIKLRHFLILCLIFIFFAIFSWFFALKDYQKARILSFIYSQNDYLGAGWNRAQALIAIGSGGIFGKGITAGSQIQYGFLPEPQTDFIFSAIAEETGLVGVATLFFLISFLLWRIFRIAIEADNNFIRLFAAGFAILLGTQTCIHIGMNLGLLPIVGLPLPFVSYGGSGLIAVYAGLGILQSMKRH
jgi:rod shape determining protein RodA